MTLGVSRERGGGGYRWSGLIAEHCVQEWQPHSEPQMCDSHMIKILQGKKHNVE